MEHTGGESARPYIEKDRLDFPTAIDTEGATVSTFGFRGIPNGILVDRDGIVRFVKAGGFSVDNEEDRLSVDRFLRGEDVETSSSAPPYELLDVERELVEARIRLGHLLNAAGRPDEAVQEWRLALRNDPENLVIRKQIWALEHPDRFHPTIDWDWQRDQLAHERDEEITSGICGPDGCPIR